MNRIFISYRSSDGKKDAARLAADLNERFGEQLVFYDKQDLVGGSSWRDAINATLGSQPVVLVLVTPDLLGAPHPEGGRRVDRENDPIRGELLTARHSGAVIIPLLTDGMQMPASHQLPAPLQFLSEAHARPLRTDDWNADLQRIVDDLRAHRIAVPAASPPTIQPLVSPMGTSSPHGLLREAASSVRPGGHLLIIGINPWSTWGLRHVFAHDAFRQARCISSSRVGDWLNLLGFALEKRRFGCYRPPLSSSAWQARLAPLETWGAAGQPPGGGFYVLVARKLVVGLRPLRQPSRQPMGKLVPMPVAKVSRREPPQK